MIERTVYMLTPTTRVAITRDRITLSDPWFGERGFPIPATDRDTEDFLFDLQMNSHLDDKDLRGIRREFHRIHVDPRSPAAAPATAGVFRG